MRSTHMPEVRCGRVAVRRVRDDAAPMPLMEGVSIKPVAGTPFLFDVFPDTGCYQSPNLTWFLLMACTWIEAQLRKSKL